MSKVDVLNWEKKKVGEVELNADVFEAPVRKDVMHSVVRWQLACRRQGTHKSKTRGEVSGGGKKPFKQKGTGNARQGSTRSPLLEGGGTIFGPKPRDYSYVLPKKIKKLGLKSALSHLNKEGKLFVIDELSSTEGKTKELAQRLNSFGAKKAVLIGGEENALFKRAARNIPGIRYYSAAGLNVFDLLKYDYAIVSQDSIAKIQSRLGVEN